MPDIDITTFNSNLLLTQAYCELQLLSSADNNTAAILRSFNPLYNGDKIFAFEKKGYYFTTEWLIDPWPERNEYLYNDLFKKQIENKNNNIVTSNDLRGFNGKILVAEIDCTVTDGASEADSLGFIDVNDCPPIDTWFYLTKNELSRLLFCWIPQQFVQLVNFGIEVNPVDCFYWFDKDNRGRIQS